MNPTNFFKFLIAILLIGQIIIQTATAGDINGSMSYGGKNRTYLLHIPTGYNAATPTPLVFVFHGLTGTGSMMADITKFSPLADQENFIVVYPDGISKKWASPGGNIDDVGFISALIDVISSSYNVDANRVFATGASNGGMFTYRLGMELTDRFAAIASIAGFLPNYSQAPVPSKHIPVLHFHGTADGIIPLSAGENAVDYWVDFNGTNQLPATIALPNADPGDGTTVDEMTYANGMDNSEVILYKVFNGGHTWPGTTSNAMPGKVTKDISASEIIWEYFKAINQPSNTVPIVTFTKPVTGVQFTAPASIQLKATAVDADGTIKHVKFYNGSSILKTDLTSAYAYTWNNVPAGVYTIIAETSDNENAIATDTTIVTVNPAKLLDDVVLNHLIETSFDPSQGHLLINKAADATEYDLFIYNVMGIQMLALQHVGESNKIISTDDFEGGIYLYVVKMKEAPAVSGKFTVNH